MSSVMVEQSMSTSALLSTSFDGGKEHHHSINASQSELGSLSVPSPSSALPPTTPPEKNSSREVIDSQQESASSLVGNGHVTLPSVEGDSTAITTDDSLTEKMPGTLGLKASSDDTSADGGLLASNDQVHTFVRLLTFVKLLKT